MPKERDIERDKAETRRLILDPNRAGYTGGQNWLGHGGRGGKDAVIDYLLLDGATMERLLQERRTEASIRSHFQSLKTLHDLRVTRGPDGKYRFDRAHLGIPDSMPGSSLLVSASPDAPVAGQYKSLADYLSHSVPDHVRLTFHEVEQILGFSLPDSARKYSAWWSNSRTKDSHTWAHLWLDAGWEKESLNLAEKWVTFRRVRAAATRAQHIPSSAVELLAEDGALTPTSDADEFKPQTEDRRKLVERQIRERRGQTQFRNDLRARYGDRCQVSGCEILAILEAAHISPFRGEEDHHPANGLLLRADIHTLFDLDLLGVEPATLEVRLHPGAVGEYGRFEGTPLRCRGDCRPSYEPLLRRYSEFMQRLREPI
jgi:HNH endonuclease